MKRYAGLEAVFQPSFRRRASTLHDQARRAAAFTSFRADQELQGDPPDIALKWLRQSGLA